jgi:hypothetical protein
MEYVEGAHEDAHRMASALMQCETLSPEEVHDTLFKTSGDSKEATMRGAETYIWHARELLRRLDVDLKEFDRRIAEQAAAMVLCDEGRSGPR